MALINEKLTSKVVVANALQNSKCAEVIEFKLYSKTFEQAISLLKIVVWSVQRVSYIIFHFGKLIMGVIQNLVIINQNWDKIINLLKELRF